MMDVAAGKPLTGRKVLAIVCSAFAVIIGVNLTLAYQAIATFPGLEVKNSYVASQSFDVDRAGQEALNWDVKAIVAESQLRLSILRDGVPVRATIVKATLGRPTNVAQDQMPNLIFDGLAYVAPVTLEAGNWDLWLEAEAEDGTIFKQRMAVSVRR